MEHNIQNLADLFDKLAEEEQTLAKKSEDLERYGVAYEHSCKAIAYRKVALIVRHKSQFDQECGRIYGSKHNDGMAH